MLPEAISPKNEAVLPLFNDSPINSGVAGGGGGGGGGHRSWQQSPRGSKVGRKIYNLNETNFFVRSVIFKVLRKITRNSMNNYEFFKFIISFRGDHCDCSRCASKNLSTPLPIKLPVS
jgi:hypothetical protein